MTVEKISKIDALSKINVVHDDIILFTMVAIITEKLDMEIVSHKNKQAKIFFIMQKWLEQLKMEYWLRNEKFFLKYVDLMYLRQLVFTVQFFEHCTIRQWMTKGMFFTLGQNRISGRKNIWP